MFVFSAILFALLYGVDAGFEYNNATDRTDADVGFRDVDVIISTTSSHYLNKAGSSGSIDGIAPTDSVNLLTQPMEKEPAIITTLYGTDPSTHSSNLSYVPPNPPKNVRVSSTSYHKINLSWSAEDVM